MSEHSEDGQADAGLQRRHSAFPRREADTRFQAIFDHAFNGMILVALETRELTSANPAFLRMTGYTPADLPELRVDHLHHAHDLARIIGNFEKLAGGETSFGAGIPVVRRDGSIFHADINGTPFELNGTRYVLGEYRDISERLAAEEALRQSEERFRSLLWNIPSVAVQGYGFDGTTHYWNRASEQLYGYTQAEALGKNLLDLLIPPDMVDGVKAEIAKMVDTGQPIPPAELSLLHKDGSRLEVFSSHAIVQVPGQPPELFCLDIDLSQPKQAEAARQRTERRLTIALNNAPVAVFEQDTALRYTWSFNYPQHGSMGHELIGKTDHDILDTACATRLTAAKRSVLDTGQPAHLETALHKPGGAVEYYDLHIEPRINGSGQIIGLIGAAINITRQTEQQQELAKVLAQRQWAEAVLREREEQLALFVEYAPASIAMFDRKMNYLAASRRWIEGHGITCRDIRGHCHYDILPDIPEKWKTVHFRCLAGAVEHNDEDSFVGADGRLRTIRWEVRPWLDNNGEVGGILIFTEDISEITQKRNELAKARAEAEQANAAKSHFLAAASHDLRQPLHALDLYVGIIADSVPASCADIVDNIKQCSTNLSVLLNELLDLSKLEAGAVTPRMQDFPLGEFLGKIANLHAPLAEQKDLLFRVASTRQIAHSDPQLLQQLVSNLVSNAIRYTPTGSILIGLRRYAGSLWIEVWDTGIGIPADQHQKIFEPFTQLGNPERNREAGTGLGLALVDRLARLLGSRIRVSSRLGRGSLFAVEVARGGRQPVLPVVDCPAPPECRPSLRVALVEDDSQVRAATQRGLQHLGHQVVAAANTDELLAGLGEVPPDMIVADYRLAGHSTGVDSIAAIRRRYARAIAAVVITGDTDPEIVRSIADTGLPVLNKPLLLDELKSFLHAHSSRPPGDG